MSESLTIYRKRFIPKECIALKDDQIIKIEENQIITNWSALKSRPDIAGGISVYYPQQGYKISKIYDHHHKLLYWYCDIIRFNEYDPFSGQVCYEDLLLDVVLYEDGRVILMDADELATALEKKLITEQIVCQALYQVNALLHTIYSGQFSTLAKPVLETEKLLFP